MVAAPNIMAEGRGGGNLLSPRCPRSRAGKSVREEEARDQIQSPRSCLCDPHPQGASLTPVWLPSHQVDRIHCHSSPFRRPVHW